RKFENKKIDFRIISSGSIDIPLDLEYTQLVWDNLLSNAFQNTPMEGTVIIGFHYDDNMAVFSFSNTGVLLPREYQGNLSQKYLSPEKHTAYHKGLGLHYSRMMCEFHGGSLEYNINAKGMNEFVAKLPVAM
ncbi:MAG: ATP-binding protein, partial [Deltaproteobacteria bacterium]|nr:ATP-binding protein [Deltaproteobacteria bacterium]